MSDFKNKHISIEFDEQITINNGHTISNDPASGTGFVYFVSYKDKAHVNVVYIAWENHEADVRLDKVRDGSQALNRLEQGLRLGIKRMTGNAPAIEEACEVYNRRTGKTCTWKDLRWAELRQARIKPHQPNMWSNLFNATKDQLRVGASMDVLQALEKSGALMIDTKAKLLDASDNTRNRLCVVFHRKRRIVPVLAYSLTRVAPLANGYVNQ